MALLCLPLIATFYACSGQEGTCLALLSAHLFRLFNTHTRDTTECTRHRQAVLAQVAAECPGSTINPLPVVYPMPLQMLTGPLIQPRVLEHRATCADSIANAAGVRSAAVASI